MSKKIDEQMLLCVEPILAKTKTLQDITDIEIQIKLLDKDKKELAKPLIKKIPKAEKTASISDIMKKYNATKYKGKNIIKYITSAKEVAKELGIEETDEKYKKISFLSFWIDADCNHEFTNEIEEWYDVEIEKQKKRLHFIFYTLTGSKNDSIFIDQVNLREKTIQQSKEYNNNIDIIYIKEVKKSSEILSYVKNKIEENGGKDEIEIKTVDLFAELFKEKKKKQEKDKSSKDTGGHWLDRMAQPYIPDGVSVDEARNVINDNVKRKEYLNKVYEANQEQFIKELKAGTIRGLGHVETFCTVAFLASPPIPHAKIFFAVMGLSANFIKSRLEQEEDVVYVTKLGLNTVFDTIADGDKRLFIAKELFVKPYLTYIVDNISKDKIEKRNR